MERNQYHSPEQFINDPDFIEWIQTGIDNTGWQQWVSQNPDKYSIMLEARNLLIAIGSSEAGYDLVATEEALQKNREMIRLNSRNHSRTIHVWGRIAAAVVVFSIGFFWYHTIQKRELLSVEHSMNVATDVRFVSKINEGKSPLLVNLSDGSTIILKPGGRLSYPENFEKDKREVILKGEAFFEISKNPTRPFLVYADNIVTTVVGTSFTIRAIEGQPNVEVFVKTGKVKVSEIGMEKKIGYNEIALLPNESVKYSKEDNHFEKSMVAHPFPIPADYPSFVYTDTPVSTIFDAIEKVYGLPVKYPAEVLKDCYLSTSMADEPLTAKLKIICEILGDNSTFKIMEDQILIESKGCK